MTTYGGQFIGEDPMTPYEDFLVVFDQPGPLRVVDKEGNIWHAYKNYKDIPNWERGPTLTGILARLVEPTPLEKGGGEVGVSG